MNNRQNKRPVQGGGRPLRVLFIGNSATYVNKLPETLERLAGQAGYSLKVESVTKGGYTLAQYAVSDALREQIAAGGYDVVFLQENSNCLYSGETRTASKNAHRTLNAFIRDSGARTYLYFRPPTEKDKNGEDSFTQCVTFDAFFGDISAELGAMNAYVNRAFAYAIRNYNFDLWGPDHAHTGVYGGYLAVCVFFATLFHTSATVLDANGLPEEDALTLQEISDKVVLDGVVPW